MPYANNQGVKIYYEVEGEGAPLVLLHGFTQALEDWREFGWVDALKHDYQLILIDVRGHGASDKPHDPHAYRVDLVANDVVVVLDRLGIHKAHYCGFSMGGWIGFQLAKLSPHRFHSFIFAGSSPYEMPGFNAWAQQQFGAGMESYLDTDSSPGLIMMPACKERKLANDPQALIAFAQDQASFADVLPTMMMPCLVCMGEAEEDYSIAQAYAKLIPNGRFVSFPKLGHGQTLRYSHQVIPPIKQFLDEVTPTSERNRAVIHRLIREVNRGNFSVLNQFYATDWVCLLPLTEVGTKDIRQLVDQLFSSVSDAEATVNDITANGDQVTTRWVFKGTLTGEWLGVAVSQARVQVSGVMVDRLCDGKIMASTFQYDLTDLQRQLEINRDKIV